MSVAREDVDRLYDEVLKPRLDALEGFRLDLKRHIVKAGLLIGVPFAMFFLGDVFAAVVGTVAGSVISALGFALIFVGVLLAGYLCLIPGFTAFINYRQRFKRDVVAEIFRIVCPSATYDANEGLPAAIFDEPGLFSTSGGYRSDDRVLGRIGQTPFEAAEVRRSYSTGGKNSRTVVVFHGLFFHLDFNKSVRGRTIVQPAGAPGHQVGTRTGLTEVTLESPEFSREFTVWASDEVEARYVLTPTMMERLVSLRQRARQPVFMAVTGNRAYIGVDYGRELFEPGIRATTTKDAIEAMADEFALAEAIVTELDLNTRIWTKDVDDALLHRVDEPPKDGLDAVEQQARDGTLTAAALWDAATSVAAEKDVEEEAGPVVQPAGSAIRVERLGHATVIRYGGRVTFLLSIGVWLLCFPVAAAAFRATVIAWSTEVGLGPLLPLARLVPAIPMIDAWIVHVPLAWLAGASVVGGLSALDWSMRVRRVEIAQDEVWVRRGLRPWPRRYPRPPYNHVTNLGKAVYLKSDGFSLLTPSASPMLTTDEARWLTTEMRRAMKEVQ